MNFSSPIKTTSSRIADRSLPCFGDNLRDSPQSMSINNNNNIFKSPALAGLFDGDQSKNISELAAEAISETSTPFTTCSSTSHHLHPTNPFSASISLLSMPRSPVPSSSQKTPTKYHDRFIPARTDSISKTLFDLKDESSTTTATNPEEEETHQPTQPIIHTHFHHHHHHHPVSSSPIIQVSPSTSQSTITTSQFPQLDGHPTFLFDQIGGPSSQYTRAITSGNTTFLIQSPPASLTSSSLFPRSLIPTTASTATSSYLSFSSPTKKKKPTISQKDENAKNYSQFMQRELFGTITGASGSGSSPIQPSNTTQEPSILKFHCDSTQRTSTQSSTSSHFSSPLLHRHRSHILTQPTSQLSAAASYNIMSPDRIQKEDKRKISKTPFKVLDAPGLQDDFYIDLLDWSSRNQIAVGLGKAIFIWNAGSGSVDKLCENVPSTSSSSGSSSSLSTTTNESESADANDPFSNAASYYTSLKWSPNGTHMAIGNIAGKVDYWDVNKQTIVRTFQKQAERIGSIDFNNNNVFAAGSKDKSILIQDIRDPTTLKLAIGHKQEVCQVRWSPDQQYLASGGNDNAVLIWNFNRIAQGNDSRNPYTSTTSSSASCMQAFQANVEHRAAVRALAWNPHQYGVLLSGGGSRDQTIKVWNVNSNCVVNSIDVGSQVCKLTFSPDQNEFVAAHGFEYNRITVWKYPSLSQIVELEGHQSRVLFMSLSPDAQSIVTGAGDETLKLWKVFQGKPPAQPSQLEQLAVIR